ncbi:MAG: septum formation initiator [Ruminococcus sp.]|nr:septum formation initiator [Ruminococcus sp.]
MRKKADMMQETDNEEKLSSRIGDLDEEDISEKKAPRLFRPILFIIILCFCVFAAVDIVVRQNEIEQLKQETEMMTQKLEESKQLNDEYEAMLNADEAEFMEKVAVEKFGYSYPNEKRFYIVNKE